MPTAPSAFPLLGAPQAPGDKPNLPEGSKSLGGRPPEAVGNTPQAPRHTRPDPRPDSTAGQSATQHLERSRPRAICRQTELCRTGPAWPGLNLNSPIEFITESYEKEFVLPCSFFNSNSLNIFSKRSFCFHNILGPIVAALLNVRSGFSLIPSLLLKIFHVSL